jgi:arylsulfatase A-like enzyme
VDDNVGRVLDTWKKAGSRRHVGFLHGGQWIFSRDKGCTTKRFMYEPSLRVPLLARGPRCEGGRGVRLFALNNDFAPRF